MFVLTLIALTCALPHFPQVDEDDDISVMFSLDVKNPDVTRAAMESQGFDVLRPHENDGPWFRCASIGNLQVIARSIEERAISNFGEIVCKQKAQPFREVNPPAGYDTPEDILNRFQELAAIYPDLAQLIDLNQFLGTALTVEGRRMYALKISDNVTLDEVDEPNLLINSNHHARELITPQLAQDTAERLLTGYGSDSTIRSIVDNNQIYIMFTCNPDGLAYVWSNDDMWRKNRLRNPNGSYGVDLNRNYPFGWDFSCGGSTSQSSDTYRGPSAGSERETQTIIALHTAVRFVKVLDFHSYARDVRYNYADCATLPASVSRYLQDLVDEHREPMNYAITASCCTGGHIGFSYHDFGGMSHLSETGTAFQPPAEQMRQELVRVWPGTLWFLQKQLPATGFVRDSVTLRPVLDGSVRVSSLSWSHGERWAINPNTGRYVLWLPNGSYTVVVSAAGYADKSFTVVASESGVVQDLLI